MVCALFLSKAIVTKSLKILQGKKGGTQNIGTHKGKLMAARVGFYESSYSMAKKQSPTLPGLQLHLTGFIWGNIRYTKTYTIHFHHYYTDIHFIYVLFCHKT